MKENENSREGETARVRDYIFNTEIVDRSHCSQVDLSCVTDREFISGILCVGIM
jgi:hypothetical protein